MHSFNGSLCEETAKQNLGKAHNARGAVFYRDGWESEGRNCGVLVVVNRLELIALAPLFIVWLGFGLPSRVTFSIFISFFPIPIATAAGLAVQGTRFIESTTASRSNEA
jgi:hypothetical protein